MSDKRQQLQQEATAFFGPRRPTPPTPSGTTTTSTASREAGQAPAPAGGGRPAPRPGLAAEVAAWRTGASSSGTSPSKVEPTPGVADLPAPNQLPAGALAPTKNTPVPTRPYTVVLMSLPNGSRWLGFARKDDTYVRTSEWPPGADWKGTTVTLAAAPPMFGSATKPAAVPVPVVPASGVPRQTTAPLPPTLAVAGTTTMPSSVEFVPLGGQQELFVVTFTDGTTRSGVVGFGKT